jgi:hypothetical protein
VTERHIVELVGTLAFGSVYAIFRKRINKAASRFGDWFAEFVLGPEFYKVAEVFFNEAAVLWFVFPLLDNIYQVRKPNDFGLHLADINPTMSGLAGE